MAPLPPAPASCFLLLAPVLPQAVAATGLYNADARKLLRRAHDYVEQSQVG